MKLVVNENIDLVVLSQDAGHVERIASCIHYNNNLYRESLGEPPTAYDGRIKEGLIKAVYKEMGVILKTQERTPQGDSHNNWLRSKEEDGYTYGDVQDDEKKTHPNLISFGELPVEQRAKDDLFLSQVLMALVAMNVVRLV